MQQRWHGQMPNVLRQAANAAAILVLFASCVQSSTDGEWPLLLSAKHNACGLLLSWQTARAGCAAGVALLQFSGNITNFDTVSAQNSFKGWVNGTDPCLGWTGVTCNTDDQVTSL